MNGYEVALRYGFLGDWTTKKIPIRFLKSDMDWYDDEEKADIIRPFGRVDEEAERFVFEEVEVREDKPKEKKSKDDDLSGPTASALSDDHRAPGSESDVVEGDGS
jgi:hypothetical protein